MSELEHSTLENWNLEPEMLLDHPLCAPASEEERKWIEQQLEQAISSTHGGMTSPQSTVFGSMVGGGEHPGLMKSMMQKSRWKMSLASGRMTLSIDP